MKSRRSPRKTATRSKSVRLSEVSAESLQLSDEENPTDPSPVKDTSSRPPSQLAARGSSGTKIFAGYLSEEYLTELRGTRRADTYDKMRRSDGQVKMVTSAVVNLIKGAKYEIEAGGEGPEYEADRELVEEILFRQLDKPWESFIGEACTSIYHGYSLFEVVHKVVKNHPKFGTFNAIDSLGFRSQRTIERWNIDPMTGKLASVTQMAFGDAQKTADIPAEFLLHFPIEMEGTNYEGISPLRPCFGPYTRKELYLKLMAIGMEKSAVPTPHVEIPDNKENTPEYAMLVEALQAYGSHESSFLFTPKGWPFQFVENDFDPEKCIRCAEFEDKQMSRAFVTNFLELGQSGGGGSYALGTDLSDFFLAATIFFANGKLSVINRQLIPSVVRMNRGPRDYYPKVKHSGIGDNFGKEFAEVLQALSNGRWLTPDEGDETHLRKRVGLPASQVGTRRPVPVPQATANRFSDSSKTHKPRPRPLDDIRLSEKPRSVKLIESGKEELASLMREKLKPIAARYVEDIMRAVRASTPAARANARRGISAKGELAYRTELEESLAQLAARALEQARKEVPKARSIQLHDEQIGSMKLSELEKLPKRVKDKIQNEAERTARAHVQNLENRVSRAFDNSQDSTDSDAILENDLKEVAEGVVEAAGVQTAASDAVASIVNAARNSFFFEPEVVKEIASFTFYNSDPKTEVCEDLAGQTFRTDDPGAWRYFPPLHHNCKSVWLPNPIGREEPEITGLRPSRPELEDQITLSEQIPPWWPLPDRIAKASERQYT